jgi:hypothetical protein
MIHPVPIGVAIVLALLGLVGLGCVSWAIAKGWRQARRRRAGCVATAKVIKIETVAESDGDPMCVSVVEFRDTQGRRREARTKVAQHPAPHRVGQRVEITYEPGDPADMDVVTSATGLVIAAVLGAALAGGMAGLYWGVRTGALTVTDGGED